MEQAPTAEALSARVLAHALQDVLDGASDGPTCDPGSLEVLRQTAQARGVLRRCRRRPPPTAVAACRRLSSSACSRS